MSDLHDDNDADESQLPATTAPEREYIRVQPTDATLRPDALTRQFRRLHTLGDTDQSLLDSLLRRSDDPLTIEFLLVAGRGANAPVTALVGTDDPDVLDALERSLRELLPTTYECERVTRPADHIATTLGSVEHSPTTITYRGDPDRPKDWQTGLTPVGETADETSLAPDTDLDFTHDPLATIVDAMATSTEPMVYQALLQPYPDWTTTADERQTDIRDGRETVMDRIVDTYLPEQRADPDDRPLHDSEQRRIDRITKRDTRHSFVVNARLALGGTDGTDGSPQADQLATAFETVSGPNYTIDGGVTTGDDAHAVLDRMLARRVDQPTYDRYRKSLPLVSTHSRGIVADPREVGQFCVLDGGALTTAGERAVAPTRRERTTLPRPPVDRLPTYRGDGLTLGTPLTQDGTPDTQELVLPPDLQSLHTAWFGKTGSGKSTALTGAVLDNHAATDGASILVLPKGDGMATDYLRSHYARFGSLEDVLYFDCAEVLPAFSVLDIRAALDAGMERETAVEETVDHYMEMLTQIMGRERFEQAVRSPDVIRYVLRAMFDPVHGSDAVSHREFHQTVLQMHERQSAPAVSDDDLEALLAGVVANRKRSFDEIMQGVANRIEKIPVDQRLGRIFNNVAGEDTSHFDLGEYLNEDTVIIFDTGSLRSETQRVLALLVFSNLWTALRRRATADDPGDDPLVNLYVEEAASIAVSDLLRELLAQARGFDCAVTLAMQFPGQLRRYGEDVYDEVLNNVGTMVTGNVPSDRRLAERLATADMATDAVGNRLRALERGQWFVNLAAPFDEPTPRPFVAASTPPPVGHPASSKTPATDDEAITDAIAARRSVTRSTVGLTLSRAETVETDTDTATETPVPDAEDASTARVDSALPWTKRLPPTVTYAASLHALQCTECGNRYDPHRNGMERAIECCSSLAETDRDDVPICDVHLKLTADERDELSWSTQQLLFLQAVYNAQQQRYDPLEYDLLRDSMVRLREYVGVESGGVDALIDAGLLRHDTDHPHRLYTVTPEGRDVLGESYRAGVDYGHGQGDLEESSQHVFAVEVGRQYLIGEYVEDPDSPVTEVVPYYDLDSEETQTLSTGAFMGGEETVSGTTDGYESRRLDAVGLDESGDVVVALEAERVNNDVGRAVPDDFDKMAACEPDAAIWIVMNRDAGHRVLAALNDPPDGRPRVEKTYAETTPPNQFRIDTPGLTRMTTINTLRQQLGIE